MVEADRPVSPILSLLLGCTRASDGPSCCLRPTGLATQSKPIHATPASSSELPGEVQVAPLHCTVQATQPRQRLKVPSCVIAIQLVGFPRTVPSSASHHSYVLQLSP
ncbi:hypothetical protein LY76DRAFT_299216 [Colletotrichum caudatum]|nr:hypothetical protein LY76DRAFT_299216 [Colletotrichum caudatum]